MSGRELRREKEPPKIQEVVFLRWGAASPQHIQTLLDKESPEQLQLDLMEILGYRNHQTCMKESLLLDYYTCGLWWAKEANFNPTQTSFIMAVLQMLLDNIREKQMTLVDNLTELAKALSPACQRPPSEEGPPSLLDCDQAEAFVRYVRDSLIQKSRLFELVSSVSREEQLSGTERTVEVFGHQEALTPLEEGVSPHLLQ